MLVEKVSPAADQPESRAVAQPFVKVTVCKFLSAVNTSEKGLFHQTTGRNKYLVIPPSLVISHGI
eukprot:1146748-Pelagomonas_calceolata.AAC.2